MRFAMVLALAGSALLYSGCTKDYQKDIDDLNSGVTTLQGTVQKLQEQVSALEALKSQLASLQGDVASLQKNADAIKKNAEAIAELQAAIDKNTEAIAKLQEGGYVTKDELDTELTSLREETEGALDLVAICVAANSEAIDALKEAYEKTDAVAKALNVGKIASVALVRKYGTTTPDNFVSMKAWKLVDAAPATLYETSALLNLTYQVSPASLAASLSEDNVALSIYSPKKKDYIEVPVTITEIDEEAGIVSLFANLFSSANKANFENNATQYYTPFALVINNESDNGVVNDIKSQYDFAEVNNVAITPTVLKYHADFDDIEVPYDKFASSERKFFDGIEFKLMYTIGATNYYMSLDEAAGIFGVDVAVITPVFKSKLAKSAVFDSTPAAPAKRGSDYISYDLSAWTAKMKATKLDDAKKALTDGAWISANATAYITKGGITKNVWSEDQKYSVVNAEGTDITIGGARIPWEGKATVAANKTLNREPSKKITDVVYLYRTYKDNNGNPLYNEVKVDPDGNLVNVTPYETNPGTAGAPAGTFDAIPYTDKEQNLEFTGVWTNNNVDYPVSMTLTIGAKPANKTNLDLGTFRVDGSYTKDVNVDLSGIIAKLIGNDEDLFADVPTKTLKAGNADLTENPLYALFAENLYKKSTTTAPTTAPTTVATEGVGAQIEATSVIKETDETSTAMAAANYKFTFQVPQTGDDKGKDKSILTLPLPTENGETYVVGFAFTAFGVNYEGNLKVEIAETGNFYLKTTGLVGSDNVIPVTWNATANGDKPIPTIGIANVNFADYLELNKDLKNEDPTTLKLKLVIDLEGATGTKTDAAQTPFQYTGSFKDDKVATTTSVSSKMTMALDFVKTTGTVYYTKKIDNTTTAGAATLVWNDFSGDVIKAKATLYKNYTDDANRGTAIGEPVKLTLKRTTQIRKMELNPASLTIAFNPGDVVKIDLGTILKLTSEIGGTQMNGSGQLKADAEPATPTTPAVPAKPLIYSFGSHSLMNAFGLVDANGKFKNFAATGNMLSYTTTAGKSGEFDAAWTATNAVWDATPALTTPGSYILSFQTNNADYGYTIKFKLGLDLANTPNIVVDDDTPHTAEHAIDVEIKLVKE